MRCLKDQLVVVTGASYGIGAAVAKLCGRQGARVVLVARSADKLQAVAQVVQSVGGTAHVCPFDLTDTHGIASFAAQIEAAHGSPAVVFHIAGVGRWLAIDESSVQDAVDAITVPYLCTYALSRAFLPGMLARDSGRLVLVSSPLALWPFPGATPYAAARAAVSSLAEQMRADLRGSGVGVSHMVLGLTETTYDEHNPGTFARVPGINRIYPKLSPEDAAQALVDAAVFERAFVVKPFLLAATVALHRVFPWLAPWLVRVTGWKRPPRALPPGT